VNPNDTPERADSDPDETREWLDALQAVVAASGPDRGLYLIDQLQAQAISFDRLEQRP